MKLLELIRSRTDWRVDETVYVMLPWSVDAEAVVLVGEVDTTEPIVRSGKIYDYFLEGSIIREMLEDLDIEVGNIGAEVCGRLIRYALDDA